MTRLLAALLLVAWLALEGLLRSGNEARSWEGGDADRSSTRLIIAVYVVAFAAPFLIGTNGFGATPVDSLLAWIGIAIGAVGLAIRSWSMRVLGRDYTRSLRTRDEQSVVDRGPYRVVRHPGYLGSVLVWAGSRLAVNWFIAILTVVVLLAMYGYRIHAEERMLSEHFGPAYSEYKAHTWRLVPFVW